MEITLPKCKAHESHTCEFFCKQCEAVICGKCLVSSHKKHEVEDLEDLCKSKGELIAKERDMVRNAISLYQQLEMDIDVEEQVMKDQYRIIETDIVIHAEKLEAAVKKAKEQFLEEAIEKRVDDVILLEQQRKEVLRNLEEARSMEHILPERLDTCEKILAFCKLEVKSLPPVPKLQRISPPEFVPNTDHLEKMRDHFGNLVI
ncbi:E3 ubiquitin-protein ligase TRIM45-like [Saccostrea echinata]|uniref:E3 ubiquitin-protein ligase TRIM45-like n=1 Tax=Saccostrea echinata TaxID=191078 RepID=UPI002A836171|nr:E3 ubiquitin-protein ligase TRIM45-like [Saccostrea echinata]